MNGSLIIFAASNDGTDRTERSIFSRSISTMASVNIVFINKAENPADGTLLKAIVVRKRSSLGWFFLENSGDFVSLHKTPKFSVDVDLYEHELLGVRPASPHLDSNPAEIYRNAITNMGSAAGRKRKRTPSPKKVNTAVKTSALVRAEDYVGDDWLIWDVVDEVETKLNKDAACFVSGGNFRNSASKSRKTVAVDDIMACTVPLPGSTESAVSSSSGSKGKVPLIHRNKSRAARLPPVLILNDGGAVESEADILDMPEDEVTEEDVLPANNLAVKQTSARSGTLRPSPASVIISVDRSHSGGEDYRQGMSMSRFSSFEVTRKEFFVSRNRTA